MTSKSFPDFLKLSPEWIDLFFKYDTNYFNGLSEYHFRPFYETEKINLVLYYRDEEFDTVYDQLKKEGFYPFYDANVSRKSWTKQGIFLFDDTFPDDFKTLILNEKKDILIIKDKKNFNDINLQLIRLGYQPVAW